MVRFLVGTVLVATACGATAENPAKAGDDSAGGTGGMGAAQGSGGTGASASGSGGGSGSGGTVGARDAGRDATFDGGGAPDASEAGAEDARACTPPDAAHEIPSRYCAAVAALPCGAGFDVTGCTTIVEDSFVAAEARGCACALQIQIACGLEHGLLCPTDFDDLRFAPACAELEDRAQRCMGKGDNCSHSITVSGPCSVACDQYAASCSRAGAAGSVWTCTCSYGPKLGTEFTATTCDEVSVANACR